MLAHLLRKRLSLFLGPKQTALIQPPRPQGIALPKNPVRMGPHIAQIPTHRPRPNMISSLASSLVCHHNPPTYQLPDSTRKPRSRSISIKPGFHPLVAPSQTLRPTATTRRYSKEEPKLLPAFLFPTSYFLFPISLLTAIDILRIDHTLILLGRLIRRSSRGCIAIGRCRGLRLVQRLRQLVARCRQPLARCLQLGR
jgi:hypothetical protein